MVCRDCVYSLNLDRRISGNLPEACSVVAELLGFLGWKSSFRCNLSCASNSFIMMMRWRYVSGVHSWPMSSTVDVTWCLIFASNCAEVKIWIDVELATWELVIDAFLRCLNCVSGDFSTTFFLNKKQETSPWTGHGFPNMSLSWRTCMPDGFWQE